MPVLMRGTDVVHTPYIPAAAAAGRALTVVLAGAFAALAALLTTPASTAAQAAPAPATPAAQGTLTGSVKDSAGAPIANVEVTALRVGKSVRTDSTGRFALAGLPPGTTDVSFRRLAFEPVVLLIDVPSRDTADVVVTLGVAAQRLTAVVVQAHPERLRELLAFESRRKQGIGHFITRAQIEKRNPLMLSDMVRMIPGTIIIPDMGRPTLRFSRVARNNCPPQFFVDGVQVTGFSIDDLPPDDVEAVELYAGIVGLPPEFNRVQGTAICGSVIIWTRIPSTARRKP